MSCNAFSSVFIDVLMGWTGFCLHLPALDKENETTIDLDGILGEVWRKFKVLLGGFWKVWGVYLIYLLGGSGDMFGRFV